MSSKPESPQKSPPPAKKPGSTSNSRAGGTTPQTRATPQTGRNSSPPKPGLRSASSVNKNAPQKPSGKKPDSAPGPYDEYSKDCPRGLYRLFLTNATQQLFNLRTDDDITQEDNIRMIPRQQILDDLAKRNAGSDFHPLKPLIEEYQAEEIPVIYDYDFQFDKNFYLCLNDELREFLKMPPLVLPPEAPKEPPKYMPPVSKPWVTYGSEKEIDAERLSNNRPLLSYEMSVPRENFKRKPTFKDVDELKDGCVSIAAFEDPQYQLKVLELDKYVQAAPDVADSNAQTVWRYPKNATTQYEPREMDESEANKILSTDKHLSEFMETALSLFESALQQNEIMNAFEDDWRLLGEEMSSIGGPGDIHLKEYQSFTDIHNSKSKVVTCVQWHPTLKGIVAMSLAANYPLYERIDNLAKSVVSPSLILIWSFFDPIQPKLFLEAPCDVFSFAFSPTEPHVIAGGCINGQVALWDIQQWEDRIVNPRGDHRDKDLFIPGFEDESYFQTPRIRYCALSSLEQSHTHPISHLIWIPDHFEVDKQGFPTESNAGVNAQIMTSAIDNQILFWDTRAKNLTVKQANKKDGDAPMGVPQTFKHLAPWRPYLKVTLPCSDPGGDFAPTRFSISERQGDKSTIAMEDNFFNADKPDDPNKGQFVAPIQGKPSSGKSRLLQHLNTRISIGTEDGQYVYVDWIPQKDTDTGKFVSTKAEWYAPVHDGPIVAVKHSPFFKDIILMAGGTAFSIWKEKIQTGALLQTSAFSKRLTDAEWSPSRPGVFFIAKNDGTIDVWDILDRTHAPILTQSISINKLTYISCQIVSPKQQLIAIGDSLGTLHVMEVPWSLRRHISGELQAVKTYFSRETDRRAYVKNRMDIREKEKDEMQKAAATKAGVGPPHIPSDEEIAFRLRDEFNEFLKFEASILREMGLKDDDEQPVLITVA